MWTGFNVLVIPIQSKIICYMTDQAIRQLRFRCDHFTVYTFVVYCAKMFKITDFSSSKHDTMIRITVDAKVDNMYM